MYVLHDYTVIANALYAKDTYYLRYEEIAQYRILLYQELTKRYKSIMFRDTDVQTLMLKINDHFFSKEPEGILALDKVDKEFIDSLNSMYPKDFKEIIDASRDKYNEETEKEENKVIKKNIKNKRNHLT